MQTFSQFIIGVSLSADTIPKFRSHRLLSGDKCLTGLARNPDRQSADKHSGHLPFTAIIPAMLRCADYDIIIAGQPGNIRVKHGEEQFKPGNAIGFAISRYRPVQRIRQLKSQPVTGKVLCDLFRESQIGFRHGGGELVEPKSLILRKQFRLQIVGFRPDIFQIGNLFGVCQFFHCRALAQFTVRFQDKFDEQLHGPAVTDDMMQFDVKSTVHDHFRMENSKMEQWRIQQDKRFFRLLRRPAGQFIYICIIKILYSLFFIVGYILPHVAQFIGINRAQLQAQSLIQPYRQLNCLTQQMCIYLTR
ncbi:MAG: hypothetical protein WA705_15320 [Candidatus Ozemobacteraceae bacterium]